MRRLYGKNSIRFTSKYFSQFKHNGRHVALIVKQGERSAKIIIDFGDVSVIDQKGYEWCDHYAKINIDFESLARHDKLLSIGPSFGIRVFSFPETVALSLRNYIKGRKRIENVRYFFADYKAQLKRRRVEDYQNNKKSNDRMVFFASSLWKLEPETNLFRANFINAAKKNNEIDFVGGFSPRIQNDIPGFEHLTMAGRIDFDEYLDLTKRSITTFSTPAVGKCHGWKIGEFLAMGKAVISTPLTRELPQPLLDGVHILYTDGSEENIAGHLRALQSSKELRETLEKNALAYFNENLLPEKVVAAIFQKALGPTIQ
ncbi:MAG: glycosyltransferase family 1 protein [Flavobacterium sp.]|nr:MAG: glycosyltransferase family 1 protein [Flavobacterium sp.]